MRAFKRIMNGTSAAVLTLSSLLSLGFTSVAHASAQTCLWTGVTSNVMNVASNWSSCNSSTPQAGDIISFGASGYGAKNLTNNLGVSLGGVVLTPNSSGVQFSLDTLSLANGATIDGSADNGTTGFDVTNLAAQGTLVVNNWFGADSTSGTWSIGGTLTVAAKNFTLLDTATHAGLVVQNGASLTFMSTSATPAPISSNITLGGGSGSGTPEIYFEDYVDGNGSSVATTYNVTGNITLLADAFFNPQDGSATVNVTGGISGAGFALSRDTTGDGTLAINPSTNTSATVAGTTHGDTSLISGGGASTDTAAPGTPDTGFMAPTANPVALMGTAAMAAGIIFLAARLNRKTAPRRSTK